MVNILDIASPDTRLLHVFTVESMVKEFKADYKLFHCLAHTGPTHFLLTLKNLIHLQDVFLPALLGAGATFKEGGFPQLLGFLQ